MSAAVAVVPIKSVKQKQHGLAFWMARVLEECDRAAADFAADPVHDLRVALRRCRSMADGLMALDPDRSWKDMKRAGKPLFSALGELRDVQVMQEWIQQLGDPGGPLGSTLMRVLAEREAAHKQHANLALQQFDRREWKKWTNSLPQRAARIRTGSLIFKHVALERWTQARSLHRSALRSRSPLPWHRLRIGLKRFRYIVENFLPEQHELWIDDLKHLQDLLGEIHDLDVLWATAVQLGPVQDSSAQQWHAKILEERAHRIAQYRQKMLGKHSLWFAWRAQLPAGEEIQKAILLRLKLWASFLDPDFQHSRHVARLALQLYDGLSANGSRIEEEHNLLEAAAFLHEIGLSKRQKSHHKTAYRMIAKLPPPLGWKLETLRLAATVSRYHRGALPRAGQQSLARLSKTERAVAQKLAGILRLANAFDADHRGRILRLQVQPRDGYTVIAAQGYDPRDRMAEKIAAGRHLLEMILRTPIVVKRMPVSLRTNN